MALIDDYNVDLRNRWREVTGATLVGNNKYTSIDLYSLDANLADELGPIALPGYAAYPQAFSAQTPTDFTLKAGTYLTQDSYKNLSGGSIQTNGFDNNIYLITLNAAGYTDPIPGDRLLTVTAAPSGATGVLMDYDNSPILDPANRQWWVRLTGGAFADGDTLTITGGTGTGTIGTGGVATGEEGFANFVVTDTVNHHQGTYFTLNNIVFDLVTEGYFATAPSTPPDILVKVRERGALIAAADTVWYNRVTRDEANAIDGSTNGDTYDWFEASGSGFGRTVVVLTTRADDADILTAAQAEQLLDGTTANIAFNTAGPYLVDVDQDGTNESYEGQFFQSDQINENAWPAIKHFFRKDNTTLINGEPANQYRYLNPAYAVEKDSPIGRFSGGTIFFAQGWYPDTPNAADASSFEARTSAGLAVSPPDFFGIGTSGVPVGTKVVIGLENPAQPDEMLTTEFTLAAGNNTGNNTIVVNEAIPLDKPTQNSRVVRIFDDTGAEDSYDYTTFNGSTFNLVGTLTKNYSANNNAWVPVIDDATVATSISTPLRFVAGRNYLLNARLGSGGDKIEEFRQNFQVTSAVDTIVPATNIPDAINNN